MAESVENTKDRPSAMSTKPTAPYKYRTEEAKAETDDLCKEIQSAWGSAPDQCVPAELIPHYGEAVSGPAMEARDWDVSYLQALKDLSESPKGDLHNARAVMRWHVRYRHLGLAKNMEAFADETKYPYLREGDIKGAINRLNRNDDYDEPTGASAKKILGLIKEKLGKSLRDAIPAKLVPSMPPITGTDKSVEKSVDGSPPPKQSFNANKLSKRFLLKFYDLAVETSWKCDKLRQTLLTVVKQRNNNKTRPLVAHDLEEAIKALRAPKEPPKDSSGEPEESFDEDERSHTNVALRKQCVQQLVNLWGGSIADYLPKGAHPVALDVSSWDYHILNKLIELAKATPEDPQTASGLLMSAVMRRKGTLSPIRIEDVATAINVVQKDRASATTGQQGRQSADEQGRPGADQQRRIVTDQQERFGVADCHQQDSNDKTKHNEKTKANYKAISNDRTKAPPKCLYANPCSDSVPKEPVESGPSHATCAGVSPMHTKQSEHLYDSVHDDEKMGEEGAPATYKSEGADRESTLAESDPRASPASSHASLESRPKTPRTWKTETKEEPTTDSPDTKKLRQGKHGLMEDMKRPFKEDEGDFAVKDEAISECRESSSPHADRKKRQKLNEEGPSSSHHDGAFYRNSRDMLADSRFSSRFSMARDPPFEPPRSDGHGSIFSTQGSADMFDDYQHAGYPRTYVPRSILVKRRQELEAELEKNRILLKMMESRKELEQIKKELAGMED